MKGRVNPSSIQTYANCQKHLTFFDPYPIDRISSFLVDDWLRAVKDKKYLALQHKTRLSYRKELSMLHKVFNFYCEYHDEKIPCPIKKRHRLDAVIDAAKFNEKKSKNQSRYMTMDQAKMFLDQLSKQSDYLYFALALFQFSTGTRIGEASAVTFDCILQKGGDPCVLINKNVQWPRIKSSKPYVQEFTKTVEARVCYITQDVLTSISAIGNCFGMRKGLIFSKDGINPLSYRSIQYNYDRAFKAAGLSLKGSHLLRHSFATSFLEKTGNIQALQKLLGHQTQKQTQHYAKITDVTTAEGYKAFGEELDKSLENVINFEPRLGKAGMN